MVLKWQLIDKQNQSNPSPTSFKYELVTERAKIPAGWLVRTVLYGTQLTVGKDIPADVELVSNVSITFVPDTAVWN